MQVLRFFDTVWSDQMVLGRAPQTPCKANRFEKVRLKVITVPPEVPPHYDAWLDGSV